MDSNRYGNLLDKYKDKIEDENDNTYGGLLKSNQTADDVDWENDYGGLLKRKKTDAYNDPVVQGMIRMHDNKIARQQREIERQKEKLSERERKAEEERQRQAEIDATRNKYLDKFKDKLDAERKAQEVRNAEREDRQRVAKLAKHLDDADRMIANTEAMLARDKRKQEEWDSKPWNKR